MKRIKNGFTLIELLVVVLIIGILAAVALPQYQRTVERTRAAKLYPLVKTLKEAQERYYMANGTYATSFEDLGETFGWTDTTAKHGVMGMNSVSLFNGKDLSVYLAYPPYQWCVFAAIADGKWKDGMNGLGYCFGGQWYPQHAYFCLEKGKNIKEKGDFCTKVMGFYTYKSSIWHNYFIP